MPYVVSNWCFMGLYFLFMTSDYSYLVSDKIVFNYCSGILEIKFNIFN